ncbi:MAG: SDR family oxidoreductase [Actinomycetota bacterium]|jgi:NAD(P)-dependent dehydrogenase (short-subunit alcohol dehydrogenase family)|nr:SDR family oxidoreductase [Actinomycetota bacterium]
MDEGAVVVIGGTAGIGRELAASYAARGRDVVVSSRETRRAQNVASEMGSKVRGIGVDLAEPESIRAALEPIASVHRLVIAAIERDVNRIADYDRVRALRLVTLKLVGYSEVVHVLTDRLSLDASILLFGGLAKERPYDGSTTVSTVNGGVSGMVRTLACELAPVRVNALHPGIVGDSPYWADKPLDAFISRTPIGRLVTMAEVVEASTFLLECGGMNGADLFVDGGWLLR